MSEILDHPITYGKIFQLPDVHLHTEGKLLFFYYYHNSEYDAVAVDEEDEFPGQVKLTKVWIWTKKKSIDRGSQLQIITKLESGDYLVAEVYPNKGNASSGKVSKPVVHRKKRPTQHS